ncbi:hypothetical protein FSARC_13991 [Fusarium sarcochroum]|uniref:C2H2-type domain-containing protein n=1 Tax=Fusarium sarcochroum TaxID=1208366 RepID=A0A8H4SX71_9HYPO|nr:hypothetical protein FSARC_13991 [Fusarium sarcochroum]
MTTFTLTMGVSTFYNGPHAHTGPSSSLVQTTLTTVPGNNCSFAPKQKNCQEELKDAELSSAMISLSKLGSKSTISGTKLIHSSAALIISWTAVLKANQNSGANAIPKVSPVDDLEILLHKQLTISDCPTLRSCAEYGGSSAGPKRQRSEGSEKPTRPKKHRPEGNNSSNGGAKNGNGNGQDPGETEGVSNNGEQQPSTKKFDCPFHKLTPFKYECCEGFNFTGWDRVLQHLKRRHVLKGEYCANCRTEFNDKGARAEGLKNEHIIRATCQLATAIETGKLLPIEYDDLTGLGPGSQVEKWYKGWDKLFQLPRPQSPLVDTLFVRCHNTQKTLSDIFDSYLQSRGHVLEEDELEALTALAIRRFCNPHTPSAGILQHLLQAQSPTSMLSPAGDSPLTPPGQAVSDSALVTAAARPIPPARPPESAPNLSYPGQSSPRVSQTYNPSMQFTTRFLQGQNTFSQQSSDMLSSEDMAFQWEQSGQFEEDPDQWVNWPSDQSVRDAGESDNNDSGSGAHPYPSPYIN